MEDKQCIYCRELLPIEEFTKEFKTGKYSARCKLCQSILRKAPVVVEPPTKTKKEKKQKPAWQCSYSSCEKPNLGESPLCEYHYFATRARQVFKSGSKTFADMLRDKIHIQKNRCPYTHEPLSLGSVQLDHCLPKSRFPQHQSNNQNLVWTHERINQMKGALTPHEFVYMCEIVARNKENILKFFDENNFPYDEEDEDKL